MYKDVHSTRVFYGEIIGNACICHAKGRGEKRKRRGEERRGEVRRGEERRAEKRRGEAARRAHGANVPCRHGTAAM